MKRRNRRKYLRTQDGQIKPSTETKKKSCKKKLEDKLDITETQHCLKEK
jgi:hypothetical protein